ncbi:MAG: long-chain fatty acid--CoA ligase [Gammaproteobacteria bacterium]|nr:long-chain fatty acid--CoA ligase [Gammaproteobacteria bacterium]
MSSNIISVEQANTLDGLFLERLQLTPDNIAYSQFDKSSQQWIEASWTQISDRIAQWQGALAQEQLVAGDRVALMLKNSIEWVIFDQAALSLGLVVVPLYLDDRPDNIAYILDDANVKLLCIQEQRLWKRLKQAFVENKNPIKSLSRVVLLEKSIDKNSEDERLYLVDDWLPKDYQLLSEREADKHDLATIVYTSGTTGKPKGVMLSHHNILSVAYATATQFFLSFDKEVFLSFLPLSHTLERTLGYYLPVMVGAKVCYSQSVQQLASELLLHKPTILISVPRIYEQIYGKIHAQLNKSSWVKRSLFALTISVGWQVFLRKQNHHQIRLCPTCLLWPVLKSLVADKVLAKFGGQLRIAASGGAAIPFPVSKLFLSLGLNLLQGYGLTETSPVVSFNRSEQNVPRSIGQPLDCIDVKLGDNNELLVKSPGLMLGYWNNHSATTQVIDNDGWFHTGDQASIDSQTDIITLTGRIKDILVMSNGEKIPPSDIENTIVIDQWFDQALLIGEGEAFLSAVLVFNAEAWTSLAKSINLDPFDKKNLEHKKIHQQAVQRLKILLHDFPGYAKIRRVILSLEPWTIENGLITPTLKVKRVKVIELYQKQIEAIYQ